MTGRGGAVEEEEEAESKSAGLGLGSKEGIELAVVVAVAVVIARIIICVCGLLIGLVIDQFAPLFGVCSQICIGGIYGDNNGFIQAPSGAILTTFIGLFGELIGYTIAPMTGADTTHNNEFVKSLISPHIGGDLTNCIGGINELSCPSGGTTIVNNRRI